MLRVGSQIVREHECREPIHYTRHEYTGLNKPEDLFCHPSQSSNHEEYEHVSDQFMTKKVVSDSFVGQIDLVVPLAELNNRQQNI